MHRLQQDCRSLGQGETFANRFLPTLLKEANVSRNVQIFGSRCSAVRLRCVAFEAPNPCFKRSPARPLVLKPQQQKRTTRIMAQEDFHGLGDTLREGYELTDHVVVDENHTIEGTNDVIEKLISGFKTFKEGVFKYVQIHNTVIENKMIHPPVLLYDYMVTVSSDILGYIPSI